MLSNKGEMLREPAFPKLHTLRCGRCGGRGVTIVVMWHKSAAHERLYCSPECARHDGWPHLQSEPEAKEPRRRPKS
jgi:hypothetical protein